MSVVERRSRGPDLGHRGQPGFHVVSLRSG